MIDVGNFHPVSATKDSRMRISSLSALRKLECSFARISYHCKVKSKQILFLPFSLESGEGIYYFPKPQGFLNLIQYQIEYQGLAVPLYMLPCSPHPFPLPFSLLFFFFFFHLFPNLLLSFLPPYFLSSFSFLLLYLVVKIHIPDIPKKSTLLA